MSVSADSQAILLLCSQLGLPARGELAPLKLREWNDLASRIHAGPFGRPGQLLDANLADLQATLEITEEEATRLRTLLDRGGALAIELERLESLGIWVVTRVDEDYPTRFRERMKASAPIVLFGSGPIANLARPGLAIVGSRNVDDEGKEAAEFAGRACALSDWTVFSGAARGVDDISMQACLDAGGNAIGVLADSLEKAIRAPLSRQALSEEQLTLITPYSPKAPFSVGAAMGRNKLIYALADFALIVASDAETGGTWAGATDLLKAGWTPLFVREGPNVPEGNRRLLERGGLLFPYPFPEDQAEMRRWMENQSRPPKQKALFEDALSDD